MMRRTLSQVANAAVRPKGTVFQNLYRRWLPRLGHNKALWAVAHRLCRLTWKILHQGVSYIELGLRPDPKLVRKRANKLLRNLRALGYQVQATPPAPAEANA
jgi:transposase